MSRILAELVRVTSERRLLSTVLHGIVKLIDYILRAIRYVIVGVLNLVLSILKFPILLIDHCLAYIARAAISKHTPVERKVLFLTYQGDYTCNPKYIAEEMIRQGLDKDTALVWDVRTDIANCDYPLKLRFVKHQTYEFYKELASAKVIIENTNIVERLGAYKKKDQVLLQTWHGSLGIKRLDGDVVMGIKWKRLARICQKNVNYLLSNSDFEDDVFKSAYWKDTPILRTGHARNDVFFETDETKLAHMKHKVYQELEIPENRRIFLYAPTHRDDEGESFRPFNYGAVKAALEERFGGEWQIVLRFHSRLRKASRKWIRTLPEYVTDATMYGDMQELLTCTECGVTDYSSWIFDYVLGRKPGFIVEVGFDKFKESRGFYYPIETTPFPIAKDFGELCKRIREFDEDKYQQDIDTFLAARGCTEDGHASEHIVAKIKEFLDEVPVSAHTADSRFYDMDDDDEYDMDMDEQ